MKLVALFALTALTLSAAPRQQESASATVEDAAVLEKLLVNALDALQPSFAHPSIERRVAESRDLLVAGLAIAGDPFGAAQPRTVKRARAFHLPGAGLFLALDLELPARMGAAANGGTVEPPAAADEWERARRELRGPTGEDVEAEQRDRRKLDPMGNALKTYRHATWTIDEQALERAREAVLDVLARHGRRVRGLSSDETITVALHVSGATPFPGLVMGEYPLPTLDRVFAEQGGQEAFENGALWTEWLYGRGAREAPVVRLVVRARVSDLADVPPGADPAQRLAERAQVHRY